MAGSNRQSTFAKLARERKVQERRVLKQEKKDQRKQASLEEAAREPSDDAEAVDAGTEPE